jgi:catechol 2,3-dioxygenase
MKLTRRKLVGAAGVLAMGTAAGMARTEPEMSDIPFAATTPISVNRIGLKARDADKVAAFYRSVVGLTELGRDGGVITLGAAGRPLLDVESDTAARPDDPRSAGLFHTAFLLPSRADLGRWIKHAIANKFPVDGASDHLVSEALYLTDPEGNGVEIYADRPQSAWSFTNGQVDMATERLDIAGIVASVPADNAAWAGVPENSLIGHVHLRVGNPAEAAKWWNGFGLSTMVEYGPSAVFLASGGYHHHIGANSWQSPGAGKRDPGRTGLSWVELRSDGATLESTVEDPWGTPIRTVPNKAA